MRRFYIDLCLQLEQTLLLNESLSHYIINVLRLALDKNIILFNGSGYDYVAKISSVQNKQVLINIVEEIQAKQNLPVNIHIGQALVKLDKFELILQKVTELGAYSLTPIVADRSEISQEQFNKKLARLQEILINSAQQSERSSLLRIQSSCKLIEFINQHKQNMFKFLLDPRASDSIHKYIPHDTKDSIYKGVDISLLIGPEGGFASKEAYIAQDYGFVPVNFHPNVLRTETAPIAITSILSFLFTN